MSQYEVHFTWESRQYVEVVTCTGSTAAAKAVKPATPAFVSAPCGGWDKHYTNGAGGESERQSGDFVTEGLGWASVFDLP